jgi:hypothetical protein
MKRLVLILLLVITVACEKEEFLLNPIFPNEPIISEGISLKSISVDNHLDTLVISKSHKLRVVGTYSDGTVVDLSDKVNPTSDFDKVTINDNVIVGAKSGMEYFTVEYEGLKVKDSTYVHEIEYVDVPEMEIRSNVSLVVPVVIINYFPTVDGINLDMNRAPDNYFNFQYSTLERAKNNVKRHLVLTKFGVEEGSRFRDRGKNNTDPYVGVKVVKYINVYEVPLTNWFNDGGTTIKTVDNTKLFEKLKMEELFNTYGVKEIWFTLYPKNGYPSVINSNTNDPSTYIGLPESNMQTPDGKDIMSNPYPHELTWTLPRYKNTYVFYGFSGHRGAGENLHNRGHQIESQLNHLENKTELDDSGMRLFKHRFVGWGLDGSHPSGRCGDTHHLASSNQEYGYNDTELRSTDINDWKPSGGTTVLMNNQTFLDVDYGVDMVNPYLIPSYDYSKEGQYMWLIYWFQSIMNKDNNIPYIRNGVEYKLSNWWDIIYNWDDALSNNKKLWE